MAEKVTLGLLWLYMGGRIESNTNFYLCRAIERILNANAKFKYDEQEDNERRNIL